VRRLAFVYLDAAGAPAPTPGDVRTIVISLVTEAVGDPADRAVTTSFSTRVRLRNR
jgi:hypothetical protein